MSRLWLLLALVGSLNAVRADEVARLHRLTPRTPADLRALLKYTGQAPPLLSAHRGGPAEGFPENCLATFEHTLQHTYSLLEIDPRRTKDGQLVILHDPTLERTTTGRGRVLDHTLAELQALQLKDPAGRVLNQHPPSLDEVLEWARGRTVLVLDQKDVPITERVACITAHHAEAYALVIAYSFRDVQTCYAANPDVMMEVMIPSLAKVDEFDRLGVPWANVVAFVGHDPPEDRELYQAIHARGALCLIGTSRNLDRRWLDDPARNLAALRSEYDAFLSRGADLIETDIPVPLGTMLFRDAAVPAALRHCFERR